VWVNRAKLVSEMPVLGLQYEVSLVNLKIDEAGAKICTRKTDEWAGGEGGDNKEPLVCKSIPAAMMPKAIDRNEFPKR
jgi:hypothetical protein